MDLSIVEILLLVGIVFIALTTGTAMGFGSMVITVVLASHFFEIPFLLGAMVPANLAVCIYVLARHRRHVRWRFLGAEVLPAMLVGSVVGFALFALQDSRALQLMFGILVLGLSGMELWRMRKSGEVEPLSRGMNLLTLFGAGVIHGLFASGGPLAVYAVSRTLEGKEEFRATLCALWTVLNVALLAAYIPSGVVTARTAMVSAVLMVSVIAGIVVGEWVHRILQGVWFRASVFMLLAGGAMALIGRNLAAQ